MVDYTILEYGVYAFVAYSSILMLIISTIKEVPTTKSMSIARAVYMLFGVICAFVLMGVGTLSLPIVETTTIAVNTSEVWTDSQTGSLTLENGSVWMLVHGLMGTVLVFYVIQQFVFLFFKTDT